MHSGLCYTWSLACDRKNDDKDEELEILCDKLNNPPHVGLACEIRLNSLHNLSRRSTRGSRSMSNRASLWVGGGFVVCRMYFEEMQMGEGDGWLGFG